MFASCTKAESQAPSYSKQVRLYKVLSFLFNVHINDLKIAVPSLINFDTCKYADDCTQLLSVRSLKGYLTHHFEKLLMVDYIDGQKQIKWS